MAEPVVTAAELRDALDTLGFFSPAWLAICRDQTIKGATAALATFVEQAGRAHSNRCRLGRDAALDLALAAIRGFRVQGAKRKWSDEVPYLYPVTASAWRTIEVFEVVAS